MKVKKVGEYSPEYPKKTCMAVKIGTIAAAAVLAVGTAACGPRSVGFMLGPDPTEEPLPEGEPAVDITEAPDPACTDYPIVSCEPAVDPTEDAGWPPMTPGMPLLTDPVESQYPELVGDVLIDPGDGD